MWSDFFQNFEFLGAFLNFKFLTVYPDRVWFIGWSARLLLYTPTDPGSLGGQPGSYCIPQPRLVRWEVSQFPIVYPN